MSLRNGACKYTRGVGTWMFTGTREEFISPTSSEDKEQGLDLPDRFTPNTMRDTVSTVVIINAAIGRAHGSHR